MYLSFITWLKISEYYLINAIRIQDKISLAQVLYKSFLLTRNHKNKSNINFDGIDFITEF